MNTKLFLREYSATDNPEVSIGLALDPDAQPEQFLEVPDVARWLKVSTKWVYKNSALLGGVRLTNSPCGRIRFRPADVEAYLERQRMGEAPENKRRSRADRASKQPRVRSRHRSSRRNGGDDGFVIPRVERR